MPGTSSAVEGAKIVMFGIARQSTMSRSPWWLGPSSPVMPGAVEDEDDGQVQEADVEVGLVEGPREERGVDRDDGFESAHRHARRRGDGVLLGDADVEEPLGELRLEVEQSGRSGHRRGDRHDSLVGARAAAISASENAWENDVALFTSSVCFGGSL